MQNYTDDTRRKDDRAAMLSEKQYSVHNMNSNIIRVNDKLRINTIQRENVQLYLNYKSLANQMFTARA